MVRVRVPAKVNLHLSVGPLREDGFHELTTVFHAVDLTDEVVASAASALTLRVTGEGAGTLPSDDANIAWRAAELLAQAAGRPADVRLRLAKAIPVAGGMAGGSADAAGALLACRRLWGLDDEDGFAADGAVLRRLASELGSDVAFPLAGGTAVGTGRGEVLRPVATSGLRLHWVFAPADFGISAGSAYRELDRLRAAGAAPEPIGAPEPLIAALVAGDVPAIAALLANDLQAAALSLRPELAETLDAGRCAGALAALVSGSGPTCAFLCADADTAATVADALRPRSARVRTATGPATPTVCV